MSDEDKQKHSAIAKWMCNTRVKAKNQFLMNILFFIYLELLFGNVIEWHFQDDVKENSRNIS